jgi:XamI restriction endonuclease
VGVNRDKEDLWEDDIARSVDFYNKWFMGFAPEAFKETRREATKQVKLALKLTKNLTDISPKTLKANPSLLPVLRMVTCPQIARDRLIGLAGVEKNLVKSMEEKKCIPRMEEAKLIEQLKKISEIIDLMIDPEIVVWKQRGDNGTKYQIRRASVIVIDRLRCALANSIIRNGQEKRQLAKIKSWLEAKGYREMVLGEAKDFLTMPAGTFSFRFNVPITIDGGKKVKISVDAVIMRKNAKQGDFPALFEAKSAGDFTNTNKRRKEEAVKIQQLRKTYNNQISFDLFLCGYFDSGYLDYEAAEGMDWVWEHRIDDLAQFGF